MYNKQKIKILPNHGDFSQYFPNNKGYIFIHKNNENKELTDICKNNNFKNREIYIKDEYSAIRYFKISLNNFYIQDFDGGIKKDEIEKECRSYWTDFGNPYNCEDFYKYIDICDVFYFGIIS